MARKERQSTRLVRTLALVGIAIVLILVLGISTGFASRGFQSLRNAMAQILVTETPYPTVTPAPTQEGTVDLYSLTGEVIAEAKFAEPATSYEVSSYKIDELALPHPMSIAINAEPADVSKAWRITITGGPFPVRSLGYYIWVDDASLPAKEAAEGLVGFIFDPSMLREGVKIGISYSDSIAFRHQLPALLDLFDNFSP